MGDRAAEPAWRSEEFREKSARIFKEEFEAFLPERIVDFHVHLFGEGTCGEGKPLDSAGHALWKYDTSEFERDVKTFLPGRRVKAVCFGLPEPKYDWKRNNAYVASVAGESYVPLRLFHPTEDTPEGLREDLLKGRFKGLKPYPDFARPLSPSKATIAEMLPQWCMEIANELGLVIMLHIPRKGRLADESNLEWITENAKRYPRAAIVVAHIGRAYFLKNVVGNMDRLANLGNVYIDIAMLNNWEVLEYAFTHFPEERILFGSDAPIAFAPGKSVEINDQYTYVTPVPWELSICDSTGRVQFTSFLYEELRAVKKAAARAAKKDAFVEGLFCGNGVRLLGLPPQV
jgi:uncharacterized protein